MIFFRFSQEGDLKWVETLKRVRTALTADDLTILSSLQVFENDPSLPIGATRIFYTNAEVDRYNEEKLNSLPGQVFSSKSVINSPVGCRPKIMQGKIDDTAFSDLITFKLGARVMLIYNVDVKDSLTNGQLGSIVGIISPDSSQINCVLVKFDDEHVGISLIKQYPQFQSSYPGAVPIFKTLVTYQLGGRNRHTARSQLLQLPLRLAWALTCHKVQGQTFPTGQKVIIKWDQSLQPGMAYVMLSRAKRFSDISITGQFPPRQIRCSEEAKVMCDFLELPERSPTSTACLFMNSSKITICSLNIQSLNANMEDLKADHLINSCDILFLSETWLETSYPDPLFHPKFIKTRHLKDSMIKIRLHDEGFSVIGVYRYHACPLSLFLENLGKCITPETAIITGDFNSPDSTRPECFLEEMGFKQVVSLPTHRAGNKLDLCFVRLADISFFIHPCYYSHHDCLCITIDNIQS